MADLQERYEAIQRKEKELEEREKDLRKQNVEITEDQSPNFPPFCPIVHHDIPTDIPIEYMWTVRFSLILLVSLSVELVINFIAACTSKNFASLGKNIVFSLIFMIVTIPIAFKVNYYKLYTSCKRRNLTLIWFALEAGMIAFCVIAAVGISSSGLMGIITCIDALANGSGAAKVFCTIAAVIWVLLSLGHILLIGKVFNAYRRQRGKGNASPYFSAPE